MKLRSERKKKEVILTRKSKIMSMTRQWLKKIMTRKMTLLI